MSDQIARVIKREYEDGARYLAQRWVMKKSFWSFKPGVWQWETFRMASGMCGVQFEALSSLQEYDIAWKDVSNAVYYCEEWTRLSQPDAVIKTWSAE